MTGSFRRQERVREAGWRPRPCDRLDEGRRLCSESRLVRADLERWTSSLLGRLWERGSRIPLSPDDDPMLVVGAPILEAFMDVGGDVGKRVLTAIACIDRGPLGVVAGGMAAALPATPMPGVVSRVGEVRVRGGFSAYSPRDGEGVFFQVDADGHDAHMVAAFISERLGGIAKHLMLTRVIDPPEPGTSSSDNAGDGPGLRFRDGRPNPRVSPRSHRHRHNRQAAASVCRRRVLGQPSARDSPGDATADRAASADGRLCV
jgi:hypothetical protein